MQIDFTEYFHITSEAGIRRMRIPSLGRAAFAIAMTGLGVVGLLHPNLLPLWNPIPNGLPAHRFFLCLAALISLGAGSGLLAKRSSATATCCLLATAAIWLLLFRIPNFLKPPLFEACWSVFPLLVVLAATAILHREVTTEWEHKHFSHIRGRKALHLARVIYALSLLFFGVAHFIDLQDTLTLVPGWLPGHLFWAYFTGVAFIGAGFALLMNFYARAAAVLATVEIGLFLCLVWIPILLAGSQVPFQWSEAILNTVLLAAAWVIADSYRGAPWHRIR